LYLPHKKGGATDIGAVKVSLQEDEIAWEYTNLCSSADVIQGLLLWGNKFKDMITFKAGTGSFLKENNYAIQILYIDLDRLIKKCTFTNKQKVVLSHFYLEGYDMKEIAEVLNDDERNIKGIINSICNKILKEAQANYKLNNLYWNYVKVPAWKTCTQCKEQFPATEEYFSPKDDAKDGLHPYCKECR